MKVGILIDSISEFGGIGKIAIEQVKSLKKLGIDAQLLVYKNTCHVNKYKEITSDITIIHLVERLPKALKVNIRIPFFTILNVAHFIYPFLLVKYIKNKEWDIIINHESYLTPFALKLKKKKSIPYIQFIWDPMSYIVKRVYKKGCFLFINVFLYKVAYYVDVCFIKNAEYVMLGGKSHYNFVARFTEKILILSPAVYPQEEINLVKNKNRYVFVMTAWKRGKNPEYLVNLVKIIKNIKIKMGGMWLDKSYQREFLRMVKENNMTDNIEILGELSEAELVEHYKKASVTLQTNDDRGFGMPALEAAACGCSFIIPKEQGVCELFDDGVHGYYTKEMDTDHIVSLLNKFLNDVEFSYAKGFLAYRQVVENYSWEQHGKKILECISKCLN